MKTMNSFQRKSLYAALAGVGALGVTTAAEAVNVNPSGLGQVLLYPYYTVRTDVQLGNPYNSLLTVVNSTDSVKVVKVRFLEGKNSREVIDFNLFLSAYDVWTAAVIPSPATAGGRVVTFDHSCTVPAISTSQGGPGFVDFVNFQYATGGNDPDKGGDSLDRTKEGYVEIIEMGTFTSTDTVAVAATHVSGTPPCDKLSDASVTNEIFSNAGGLFGGMTLIDVGSGTDYTADAVALDNFSGGGRLASHGGFTPASTPTPNLQNVSDKGGNPPHSQVLANNNVYTSLWASGSADAVSAVLMHDSVLNVFVLDSGTHSATDWVVTFPTKHYAEYTKAGTGPALKLFQRNFNDGAGSCDDVSLNIFDREERTTSTPLTFSPPPPVSGNAICWEANVISFNGDGVTSNLFGSKNVANINTSFQDGWLALSFFPPTVLGTVHTLGNSATSITHIGGGTTSGNTVTYFGLPLIGFEAESYVNGVTTLGVLSNFGGNFVHKTTTSISQPLL
jgi:hypothetical protein